MENLKAMIEQIDAYLDLLQNEKSEMEVALDKKEQEVERAKEKIAKLNHEIYQLNLQLNRWRRELTRADLQEPQTRVGSLDDYCVKILDEADPGDVKACKI